MHRAIFKRVVWTPLLILGCTILTHVPVVAAPNSPPSTTQWTPAREIATKISAWFPDAALDSAGNAHIVWNASEANTPTNAQEETVAEPTIRDYLMYQGFGVGDTAIAPATDIGLAHGGEAIRNSLIVDRDGTLDVLYRSSGVIWFIKAPINTAMKASQWSTPFRISGSGNAYYNAIAQDAAGAIHVVYTENAAADIDPTGAVIRRQSLFYRCSTDGGATWSEAVRISTPTIQRGTTRPQIRVNGTSVVLIWDEGYDNITAKGTPTEGGIRRSLDGGKTWQPTQIIVDADSSIEQVTFAFGTDDHALVVWRETTKNLLRFSTSNDAGKTWSNPLTVPNIIPRPYYTKHQFDRYALTADSTGRYHLLAVGQIGSPDQLALLHLEMRDGQWSAPRSVYSGSGLPEYPGIATNGGNQIVATFFVRDNQWEIGDYRVWRVSGTTDSPAIPPRPVPTVAAATPPTLRAATPRISLPATTSVPGTIPLDERASVSRPPGIVPFGVGMFSVAGLVGATIVMRLWWVSRS